MARPDDPTPRIEYLRRTGMPEGIILQRLMLEGWSEEDLADKFVPRVLPSDGEPTPASHRGGWLARVSLSTAVLALVAFAALGFAGYVLYKPPVVYSISIPSADASTTTPALTYGALPAISDPKYYEQVKETFTVQKASFVDANLSTMQLQVYTAGVEVLTVPILAKGRVGSWWETPAGIYQIRSKEQSHFSSFGSVNMPYSMDFEGNFFIHGWPTYEDGTPVATSYSGGCIRLSTDDAKKVYDLVATGMPVVVYNVPPAYDAFSYQLKAPPVSAQEYLVADAGNGTVLLSKGAAVAAPIASISKLVSALVATDYINLDKTLTVPQSAIVYTSIARLKAGSEVRAYDLLFLMLQESSNEAAETFAGAIGRQLFVQHMNDKANAIGLTHTVFSDPSGAKGDYSTAEDLFSLLRYIYGNRQFVFGITNGSIRESAYGTPAFSNIQNFNLLKNAPATLIGGKVGQTREASETYAGIFDVKIAGQDRIIAVVVLGSQDSLSDVAKLLAFVHNQYAPGDSSTTLPTTAQ